MKYQEAFVLLRMMKANAIETILPGLELALNVLSLVDESGEDPESVTEKPAGAAKKPEKKAEKKAAAKKKPKYKPKKCERCGKEFVPRWGAQRKCDKCKDEENKVKDAAYEIASMEG